MDEVRCHDPLGDQPPGPYYGGFLTPAHGIVVQWRSTQAAQSNSVNVPGTAPVWVLASRYTDTTRGLA